MVKLCFSRGLFLLVFELRPRQALWQISALVYSKLAKARQHNPVHLSLNALLGPVHLATWLARKPELAIKSPESPSHKHKNQKGTTLYWFYSFAPPSSTLLN